MKFVPNPEGDKTEFSSVNDMVSHVKNIGYDGGIKLLMATTKSFFDALQEEGISLDKSAQRAFEMSYKTNIPRQRGLAGSSAICTAAFQCLMDWHGISSSMIPPERVANYVLRAEQKELGIAAGLQDRVVQAYDQPVFMDFTPKAFAVHNGKHGEYETFPDHVSDWLQGKLFLLLPKLDINGKSSGKIHSPVRKRWEEGDEFVREKMNAIADLAQKGKDALLDHDDAELSQLFNTNFDLRCEIFGNAVAEADKSLITKARQVDRTIGAKLPGSGGAILVFAPQPDALLRAMDELEVQVVKLNVRRPPHNKRAKTI